MGEKIADSILRTTYDFHGKVYGTFTCRITTTWDRRLYFPSEGRHAEDFSRPKKPMASAEFEPANWVPEASMLTTRPLKPLGLRLGVTEVVPHFLMGFRNVHRLYLYFLDFKRSLSPSHTRAWPPCRSLPSTTCFRTRTRHYPITLLPIGSSYFRARPFPV
jgi:hypothetical protein